MKLNLLPARTGYAWIRAGISTFFYKPMPFLGFFASFLLVVMLIGAIPVIGSFLTLIAMPALTLGMMAISNECLKERKGNILPSTPPPFFMAWLTIRRSAKSLLLLGCAFAVALLLILFTSSFLDGGQFAQLYLTGNAIESAETIKNEQFLNAVFLSLVLYLPLSAIFWFAPALMNWKQMPLAKSLFSSAYAVYKNWRAFGIYLVGWSVLFSTISAGLFFVFLFLLGASTAIGFLLMPLMMTMTCLFMASIFPSFVDCFQHHPTPNEASQRA